MAKGGLLLGAFVMLDACGRIPTGGCSSTSSEVKVVQQTVEDQTQKEKQDLLARPDSYLEEGDLVYYDKGIIHDYRQLASMTVLNKSKHAVRNMAGEIDWVAPDGSKIGTIPFSKGSLAGGDTKKFSRADGTLSNGTLQGNATKARVRFTSIALVQP